MPKKSPRAPDDGRGESAKDGHRRPRRRGKERELRSFSPLFEVQVKKKSQGQLQGERAEIVKEQGEGGVPAGQKAPEHGEGAHAVHQEMQGRIQCRLHVPSFFKPVFCLERPDPHTFGHIGTAEFRAKDQIHCSFTSSPVMRRSASA